MKLINKKFNVNFNTMLVNHYENGQETIGAHHDDTSGMEKLNN